MFKNEITLTKDIVKEYQTAFWIKRKGAGLYMIFLAVIFIVGIITAITGILDNKMNYYTYLFIGVPVFCILIITLRIHNDIRTEYQRLYELNHGEYQVLVYEISDQIIKYNPSTKGSSTINFSQIVKVFDTKNLIILLMRGNMIIPIKKDGFTLGSYDDCKTYIIQKCKSSK